MNPAGGGGVGASGPPDGGSGGGASDPPPNDAAAAFRVRDGSGGGGGSCTTGGGSGGGGDNLGAINPTASHLLRAAIATSSSHPVCSIKYNISMIQEFVAGKRWKELEEYLKKFIRLTHDNPRADCSLTHAALFIHCRRGRAMHILEEEGEEAAYKFFMDEVENLGTSPSDFIVLEELKKEIDAVGIGIKNKQLSQPENLDMIIDDYMRLYCPDTVGHVKKIASELWQFAVRVDVEESYTANLKKKKPEIRCLACQRVFSNRTISIMWDHFMGGDCKVCPKKTSNISQRLNEIPGVPKGRSTSKQKGKGLKEVKGKDQDGQILTSDMKLKMAKDAYDCILKATQECTTPWIDRDKILKHLEGAGAVLKSLVNSLEAPNDCTTGHKSSPQPLEGPTLPTSLGVKEVLSPLSDLQMFGNNPLFPYTNGDGTDTNQQLDSCDLESLDSSDWWRLQYNDPETE